MKTLGERLTFLRNQRGLSQRQVMEKLNISNLSRYENDERKPSVSTAILLADFYDVSIHWLLTGEEDHLWREHVPGIGRRIRFLRESKNISIEELEKTLHIFDLDKFESEEWTPGMVVITKLANYFNVSIDWLLTGKGKGPKEPEETWTIENLYIDGKPVEPAKIYTPEKKPILKLLWDVFTKNLIQKNNNLENKIEKMIEEKGYAVIDIEKDMPELFEEIKVIEEAANNTELKEIINMLKKLPPSDLKEVKNFVQFKLQMIEKSKRGESSILKNGEEATTLDKAMA
ncbi:helix-turn-helix domain-containing protein [Caloranaerobacter sp. DY30410]|uniref:helix-turn-helix domain-containing protein n=1 Tax=Caloranaerobacter sp. DY30410 TaxID=3238305 RepID=UPI003D059578